MSSATALSSAFNWSPILNSLRFRVIVFVCFLSAFDAGTLPAQTLRFRVVYGQEPVEWGKKYFSSSSQERFIFSRISFYLSEFSWSGSGGRTVNEPERVELMQAGEEENTMLIKTPFQPSEICFRFGLDSALQVSGKTTGALDPALGMYWAWNTGYIQCKLEGFSPNSGSKKGDFEFHLGGYTMPYPTDFYVCLQIRDSNRKPEVHLDLKPLMDTISLEKTWSVLTPGPTARKMAQKLGESFVIADSE
jgi:hypothetical protein